MFIEYNTAPPLPPIEVSVDELMRRALFAANGILYAEDGPSAVIDRFPRDNVRCEWATCIVGRTLGAQRAANAVRPGYDYDETIAALEFRFEQGELPGVYYRGGSPYAF